MVNLLIDFYTPNHGPIPTIDLRPLMRQTESDKFYEIEEYKDIIPDEKSQEEYLSSFRDNKDNKYRSIADKRIEILKNFIFDYKPKVTFVSGLHEVKKIRFKNLIDNNKLDLNNFIIKSDNKQHLLSELPKTSIHRAKSYNGYFVFIYHPNYIDFGIGKDKYEIAKIGPFEIYKQIYHQLLNLIDW